MRDGATRAQIVDRFPLWWSVTLGAPAEAVPSGRVRLQGRPANLGGPDPADLDRAHRCDACARNFQTAGALVDHNRAKHGANGQPSGTEPDWTGRCDVCGATPVVPVTGMCGPCTFGEAATMHGNW